MIDFSKMYGDAIAQTTVKDNSNNNDSTSNNYKPRFYLERNQSNYIRIVPFIDENHQPQLFRKVSYHSRIPSTWTDQNNNTHTDKKNILCEANEQGQRCRFCEQAYRLKNAGVKDWYLYARTTDYLVLGTKLKIDSNYNYIPEMIIDANGVPTNQIKIGAIFLSGIYGQREAFDNFLRDDIMKAPHDIPELRNKKAHEILGNIVDYNAGYVLEIVSTKPKKWFTTIAVKNAVTALPSSDINLNLDYFDPSKYKPENIDRAYNCFVSLVDSMLGGTHSAPNYQPVNQQAAPSIPMQHNQAYAQNNVAPQHMQHFTAPPHNGFIAPPPIPAGNIGVAAATQLVGSFYNEPLGSATISADDEEIFTNF